MNETLKHKFSITAVHDPNALPRILELFAIRDTACDGVTARKSTGGFQTIDLACFGLDMMQADILLNKIRAIVTVQSATLETTVPCGGVAPLAA